MPTVRGPICATFALLLFALLFVAGATNAAWADCGNIHPAGSAEAALWSWDFFSNYGNYMPRVQCLKSADGESDWPWITALIALNLAVIAGYLKIYHFWRRCYLAEAPDDRNAKLMQLAYIFVFCAICGYGFSVLIFFWPVYRLLALFMVGLAYFTWRFAFTLAPFQTSFTAHRLQRQLTNALTRENEQLEAKNEQLEEARTELASLVNELKRTNKELDDFAYAASHDLKAPLRAIDSLSMFIAEELGEEMNPNVGEDITKLRQRVKRMERMLSGMLQYSRIRTKHYASEDFAFRDALAETLALLDLSERFAIVRPGLDVDLHTPRAPLEQVLRNLIDNAAKHHRGETGRIEISLTPGDEYVEIAVSDDGPGIDPEYQDRIFEMFQKLERRDVVDSDGMGLALVKRIVEAHGGTIRVESGVGQGATFRFTWPVMFQPLNKKGCTNARSERESAVS